MPLYMIVLLIALMLIVTWQLAKASEHMAAIKGKKYFDWGENKLQAWSWVGFAILFLVMIIWFQDYFNGKMLPSSASDHGVKYDQMFNITLLITGIVFVITHILLFWFIYKYQYAPDRKAEFISHNNKLEIIWTSIPALVLFVLIVIGLQSWFYTTGPAPDQSMKVEIWGKQFNWMFRYPGEDNKFGSRDWRLTNDADNPLGQIWDDKSGRDDIQANELHLIKNVPVELIIGSRDVLHDVGLAHFRMKIDAVPGVMTRMWFTPIKSTNDMIQETGNKDFVYEISCDQMCGKSHYSMRGIVIVHDTKADYDEWLAGLKPYYYSLGPGAMQTSSAEATETEGEEAVEEAEEAQAEEMETAEASSI